MKAMLMAFLLSLSIGVLSQSQVRETELHRTLECPPSVKTLVADETWIMASGKTSFRIITSNDSVAHRIVAKFEDHGMTKSSYIQRKDRKGYYWERSFYFPNSEWNIVALFINNKLR